MEPCRAHPGVNRFRPRDSFPGEGSATGNHEGCPCPGNGCTQEFHEGGGFPTSASRPTNRGKGLNPKERASEGTGKSRNKGSTTNANTRTSKGVQSWRHARCGRFRANGYVCDRRSPFQNLSRNLFPPRRFSCHTRFSRFNGTARQPSP
jgi:hypothetical protein